MLKTLVYTVALIAIAIVTAFLMRGVAQSLVQPGDLEFAVDNELYEVGDAVTFDVRLAFANGEIATTTSIRLTVAGPQSFSVNLPLKEGVHDLNDTPGLVGSLTADIQMSGVIDLNSASSTPTSIISVVLKGITQGASVDISAQWLPDQSIDSVGNYSAKLLVQLSDDNEDLVSPEIEFSIEATASSTPTSSPTPTSSSTPTSEPTATPASVNGGAPGNGSAPDRTATRTRRPTRTPTPSPSATHTAIATVIPSSTVTIAEDTPESISQADARTAIIGAIASDGPLQRDATKVAPARPRADVNQPAVAPIPPTTTTASRTVSTRVVVRQSQRVLPANRSTPIPTQTSTVTPTTTPLAFVRVSSLRRFSATPYRKAPAPDIETAPSTRTRESGIGTAGILALAVAGIAIAAVVIGSLTMLWHLVRP